MQQEPIESRHPPVQIPEGQAPDQSRGIAIPTETGYQVPEGKGALVNRNSIIFTIGRTISLLGDGFYLSTLIIWITSITTAGAKTPAQQAAAAATVTGIQAGIVGARYLANLLIVPFVGVFVDRWNRRSVMIAADLVQAGLALLPLGVFFISRDWFLPAIYVSFFLLIGTSGFFSTSQSGVLQVIIARKNLPQGVSVLNILLGVGTVAGALFAPPFFLSVGPVIAITFNAASFLVSAASLIFLRVPQPALHPYAYRQVDMTAASAGVGIALAGVWKDFLRGLRFVFATRLLLGTVIMLAVADAGAAAVNAVSSGFFLSNLHAGDLRLLGSLSAALAAGGIVGAIAAGSLAKFVPLKALTVVSAAIVGLLLIALAFQTSLPGGVIIIALGGIFNSMFLVSYSALVLKITPSTLIGRVEGALVPIGIFAGYLSTVATGAVVSAFNPELHPGTPFPNPALLFQDILILGGIVVCAGSITGFLLLRRAKEEVINVEQSTGISTTAVVSEAENPGSLRIAGEGEDLGSEGFQS